jgi:hypothetical protein
LGFNAENNARFEKLVLTVYKDKEINMSFGLEFIRRTIWDWIIKTKRNSRADISLSEELIRRTRESVKEFKVYFPMLYFHPNFSFKIGYVEFGSFSDKYFDRYIEEYNKRQPLNENIYVKWKEMYRGTMYACFKVKAEKEKAQEIALRACAIAVDVLKICTNTLDYPQLKLSFDIDCRTNEVDQSQVIIEAIEFIDGLTTNLKREPAQYILDKVQMNLMEQRGLIVFNNFLLGLGNEQTELEALILQGIQQFAKSFSNTDLNQRVTLIFTILESLLLIDEDSPIIDNVSKYASKLISKEKDERKKIIKLLKEMYKIRSKWVHHAKKEDVAINDIRRLQRITHSLLIELIRKTKEHKFKKSLLDEIDDAILAAY